MAHIIKLTSKRTNNTILVNLDRINIILGDADGGSKIYFKNSPMDELVSQTVEEIYQIIENSDKKPLIKG